MISKWNDKFFYILSYGWSTAAFTPKLKTEQRNSEQVFEKANEKPWPLLNLIVICQNGFDQRKL